MEVIDIKNFVIEKLSEERLKDVQYLFKVSFCFEVSIDVIRHKHINCHGINKYIGFIAYDKETREPAAYYAVYPGFLNFNHNFILVAQSGDTMTNPKFQKQGLFVKLAEITFDYAKTIGIEIITGLPNTNSYHGFIKYLDFSELPKFSNLSLFENKFELNRVTRLSKFTKRCHEKFAIFILKTFLKKTDWFENSNRNNSNLAYMIHDEEFFKLKAKKNDLFLSINGIKVWLRVCDNNFIISDINIAFNKENNLKNIIRKLRIFTFFLGFRFLTFGSTKNSYLYINLKRFSKSESEGYTFIVKNLSSKLPLDKISLFSCDADVF